jgi:hypothetical protein
MEFNYNKNGEIARNRRDDGPRKKRLQATSPMQVTHNRRYN